MTDTFWLAFWTALPPTIAAFAGLCLSLANGKKADQIHVLVNSQATALKAELVIALHKIEVLEQFIVDLHDDKAKR